jgi:hypothetical protein
MAETAPARKQEQDFTKEVDELIPEVDQLIKVSISRRHHFLPYYSISIPSNHAKKGEVTERLIASFLYIVSEWKSSTGA